MCSLFADGISTGTNLGSYRTCWGAGALGGSHSNSDAGASVFGAAGCHQDDVCAVLTIQVVSINVHNA